MLNDYLFQSLNRLVVVGMLCHLWNIFYIPHNVLPVDDEDSPTKQAQASEKATIIIASSKSIHLLAITTYNMLYSYKGYHF